MTRQSYLDALLAGAAILVSAGAAGAADHPDFTGLWRTPTFIAALKTAAGRAPPQRPEARAVYDERVADRAGGRRVNDPADDCSPPGAPGLTYAPYPVLILQEPGDPRWLGRSMAPWDGQTLAAQTFDLDGLQLTAGGKTLEDAITIDDPKTSTVPWDTVVRLDEQPGMRQERVCPRDHEM